MRRRARPASPPSSATRSSDIDTWADLVARSIRAAGGRPGDMVHVAYGYGLFTGGLGAHYGAERAGCTVIPMSGGQTEKQVQLIQDLKPEHHHGHAVLHAGADRGAARARGSTRGRPASRSASSAPSRGPRRCGDEIEASAGIDAVDIYGLSEVMGPGVASECVETKDGPVVWEDHFYPEIIDPETGAVLPDGEEGELVFTTLTKEALPVIRYRTRDLTRLLPPTARAMRRMGKIVGRSDDMLIIRGVNLFPTQIEEMVLQHGQLSGAVPARRHARRQPRRRRGALRGAAGSTPAATATTVARGAAPPHQDADRHHRPTVDVGAPDSIERTLVGKARRVVDQRPQVMRRSTACTRKRWTRWARTATTRPRPVRSAEEIGAAGRVRRAHRRRRLHRGQGLDARALPQDAGAPDQPARALRDRRHAARRQLDQPRADPEAQGDPARQGAGRSRPRPLPLRRRRDARHLARPDDRRAAFRARPSTARSSTTRR